MIWIVLGVAALVAALAVVGVRRPADQEPRQPPFRCGDARRVPASHRRLAFARLKPSIGKKARSGPSHSAPGNPERIRYHVEVTHVVVVAAAMLVLSGCISEPPAGVSRAPGGEPGGTIAPAYPTNEAGQTYGAEDENMSFEDRPDLILVQATNGREGYVLRESLDEVTGANVSSPQEALEWQRRQDDAGWDRLAIPVFLSDGLTQIGVFEINRSSPEE